MAKVLESLDAWASACSSPSAADDTAFTAYRLAQAAGGAIRVAHVPKTIDNDLDCPTTCGRSATKRPVTRREIVHNLMVDAKTTGRWYFVVAMGESRAPSPGHPAGRRRDAHAHPREFGSRSRA